MPYTVIDKIMTVIASLILCKTYYSWDYRKPSNATLHITWNIHIKKTGYTHMLTVDSLNLECFNRQTQANCTLHSRNKMYWYIHHSTTLWHYLMSIWVVCAIHRIKQRNGEFLDYFRPWCHMFIYLDEVSYKVSWSSKKNQSLFFPVKNIVHIYSYHLRCQNHSFYYRCA